ncbi:hypothetical protein DL764_001157 [Monosporascus ibericus]|uniref:Glucose-methanol-choline oxidoreductase N-terminal domain-containing protein n=1 Tax=Monosporascus ibericus TaxID=155417 RepID=A0A4Q4TQJ8_9PEZI|nr:hypothetical protein DL764_001157 [Monosporascus ibericus]
MMLFRSLVAFGLPSAVIALTLGPTYDYVIVGGGTAGMAVAGRLSASLPSASILVIEAGPEAFEEQTVFVPGMKGLALGGALDWGFTTTPQEGANGRVLSQNRGKVLGGSSAINLMTYDRAAAVEYDDWEGLGNDGWNWDAFQRAMLKAENFTGVNTEHYGQDGVGTSGPVKAVINRNIPAHQETWIPTMQGLGIEHNLESLNGSVNGVMYQPSSIDPDRWVRSYSANAYLPLSGPNLAIWTNTRVAKVNLKKAKCGAQHATGVTLTNGTTVAARREVILSAGSLQTPGLLELSGIGRKSVLSAAGIKQLVDLPGVGENLQDHIRLSTSYQLKDGFTSFDKLRYDPAFAAEELARYLAGNPGMYDYTGSAYAFANWAQALGDDAAADLLALAEAAVAEDASTANALKLKRMSDPQVPQLEIIFSDGYTGVKGYPAASSELFGANIFTLITAIMHPFSRGSVHIGSASVADNPVINPNYLSHEYDVEAAVQAVKYARKIAATEPMASLWTAEYEPGLEAAQTDDEIREYVRRTVLSIFHPVGTAAMLPKKDGGVVDARLRVYGTKNLRVVDASVMPVLISAHIATAVYGIAEMAAEMITSEAQR